MHDDSPTGPETVRSPDRNLPLLQPRGHMECKTSCNTCKREGTRTCRMARRAGYVVSHQTDRLLTFPTDLPCSDGDNHDCLGRHFASKYPASGNIFASVQLHSEYVLRVSCPCRTRHPSYSPRSTLTQLPFPSPAHRDALGLAIAAAFGLDSRVRHSSEPADCCSRPADPRPPSCQAKPPPASDVEPSSRVPAPGMLFVLGSLPAGCCLHGEA